MKRLVLVLVAACHPTRAPTTPPAMTSTPYLALFERGHAFGGHGEITHAERKGEAWAASPARPIEIRCHVEDARSVGDATVSNVRCEAPQAALLVGGTWVATPAGLYHPLLPVDDPDELALLGEDDLLVQTTPKEREHSHVIERTQISIEALTHKGSWCVREATTAQEDHRSWTLCFAASGVTGGSELVFDATTLDRVRFGNVPDDPDDPLLAE